jgi:predicted ATP-dependent serine protease
MKMSASHITYSTKEDLEIDTKLIILKELLLYKGEENKICPICKTIQGKEKNGFKKYYCIHTRNKINKKIKKINVDLLKSEIIDLYNKLEDLK